MNFRKVGLELLQIGAGGRRELVCAERGDKAVILLCSHLLGADSSV